MKIKITGKILILSIAEDTCNFLQEIGRRHCLCVLSRKECVNMHTVNYFQKADCQLI